MQRDFQKSYHADDYKKQFTTAAPYTLRVQYNPHSGHETDNDEQYDRHYSIFQNPDTHTEEEHDHNEAFIKKQMWAAGGVVAVAALGDFSQTEKILLAATGAGNVVRNKLWWNSINNLPQNLGRIATSPQYTYAKFLHNTAEILDKGFIEHNKITAKKWASSKSRSVTKRHDQAVKSIKSEYKDASPLANSINKVRTNLRLAAHYISKSPSYLTAALTREVDLALSIDKTKIYPFKNHLSLIQSWAESKTDLLDGMHKAEQNSIKARYSKSDTVSSIAGKINAIRENVRLAGHYINNSPSYLLCRATRAADQRITLNKDSKSAFFEETRGMRKWMRKKSKTIHNDNKTKRAAIERFVRNPIGKDIAVNAVSSVFLGLGALVHVPQTLMGWNMYQQSGDLNGHLLGAGGVGVAYGILAAHKLREIPRLKETYDTFKNITADQWDNRMRHQTIGHTAHGEHWQQAFFVGLPLVGIIGKGLAYMYESTHLHHWDLDTFTSIPDKISKFNPQGALDYLTNTDPMAIVKNAASLDYSDAMTMGASAIMLASGYVFFKSGWDEAVEDFGKQTKYGFRKYIKDPINVAVHNASYSVERYLADKDCSLKNTAWNKAVKPTLKAALPQWMQDTPYHLSTEEEQRQEAVGAFTNPSEESDQTLFVHPPADSFKKTEDGRFVLNSEEPA